MSQINVDTIGEKTSANGVSIDGLNIKDSAINTGAIGSSVTGFSGIKNADMFYMSADVTSNSDFTSWSSVTADKSDSDRIGSAITESNGIFTFPQTGIYWIVLTYNVLATSGDNVVTKILTTVDNASNWVEASYLADSGSNGYDNVGLHNYLFKVASITGSTTCKCKFASASVSSGSKIYGDTGGIPRTTALFIRLGDI